MSDLQTIRTYLCKLSKLTYVLTMHVTYKRQAFMLSCYSRGDYFDLSVSIVDTTGCLDNIFIHFT
jgi:hypothetical protein